VRLEDKGRDTLHGIEESAVDFMSELLPVMARDERRQFIDSYQRMLDIAEKKSRGDDN